MAFGTVAEEVGSSGDGLIKKAFVFERLAKDNGEQRAVARGGDMAAFKKQVGDTGAACKACHDDYRAK